MAGGEYALIIVASGLITGWIGRVKGSSFFIWFLVGASLSVFFPPFGTAVAILAVVLYRIERVEPERRCPRCGKVQKLYVQVCNRCGADLYLPDPAEVRHPGTERS
jgi:hypothetical protein